jgi:hypothetical protein
MPKSLFSSLLIPPPEEDIDREAALSWLTNTLPGYETLAAHLLPTGLAGIEPVANIRKYLKLFMFRRFRMFLQCSSSSDPSPSRSHQITKP